MRANLDSGAALSSAGNFLKLSLPIITLELPSRAFDVSVTSLTDSTISEKIWFNQLYSIRHHIILCSCYHQAV
jgi:hypothetical protein